MDDNEGETRFTRNPYGVTHEHGFAGSSNQQGLTLRKDSYFGVVDNEYGDDDPNDDGCDDDDDDDIVDDNGDEGGVEKDDENEGVEKDDENELLGKEDDENNQSNGVSYVGKYADNEDDEDNKDEDTEEEEDDEDDDANNSDDTEMKRHPKKRKMKSLISSYEFAPRLPPPPSSTSMPKPHVSGRNPLTDWTEHETFVLLDAWGDKFVERGRKSLRFDEWQEVAEKVSAVSKIERTDTQCRNRLDTLKKKYKKERSKLEEPGGDGPSKWVYFKKMDMLMSTSAQQSGLPHGLDSGKYVSKNSKVHLNRANGFEKIRDSPDNLASPNDKDDSDGLPPKKRMSGRDQKERSSFRLLADSIEKFSNIYEKIEKKRRQQVQELEEMRMNFLRDLEMQRRQIIARAQADIAKIHQDDEENNISADIASG